MYKIVYFEKIIKGVKSHSDWNGATDIQGMVTGNVKYLAMHYPIAQKGQNSPDSAQLLKYLTIYLCRLKENKTESKAKRVVTHVNLVLKIQFAYKQ